MTKEDLIRMAHEAGWQYAHGESGYEPLWAFAALVASAEREACAKLCEEFAQAKYAAEAIRQRGEE